MLGADRGPAKGKAEHNGARMSHQRSYARLATRYGDIRVNLARLRQ
jgi:hypothetical protein